jgi:hypothetical protein
VADIDFKALLWSPQQINCIARGRFFQDQAFKKHAFAALLHTKIQSFTVSALAWAVVNFRSHRSIRSHGIGWGPASFDEHILEMVDALT